MENKQTGIQINRTQFFVTERGDGIMDRETIDEKIDQIEEIVKTFDVRKKQLIGLKSRFTNVPVQVSLDQYALSEEFNKASEIVERNENGRKIRKDKGKKRVSHVKGHYKTGKDGEQVWVDGFKRKLNQNKETEEVVSKVEEPVLEKVVRELEKQPRKSGYKMKGHYRTVNGVRYYVGKKSFGMKLKELVGLA